MYIIVISNLKCASKGLQRGELGEGMTGVKDGKGS